MATASPALSPVPGLPPEPKRQIPDTLIKIAAPILLFALGWYGNTLTVSAQVTNNNASIAELKATKISKDEFDQYVQQSLENQRQTNQQLAQIRDQLSRVERRGKD